MNNRYAPKTRQEKIDILKKLAKGELSATDIIPKVRLCLFEVSPGIYSTMVECPDGVTPTNLLGLKIAEKIRLAGILKIKTKMLKLYPDALFEWGIMPFAEYKRINEILENEY